MNESSSFISTLNLSPEELDPQPSTIETDAILDDFALRAATENEKIIALLNASKEKDLGILLKEVQELLVAAYPEITQIPRTTSRDSRQDKHLQDNELGLDPIPTYQIARKVIDLLTETPQTVS